MPKHLTTVVAASVIETAWIRYRDRQLFQILKMAVRTLETFLGIDILRRTSPKDYELLRDLCIPFSLRFRFSGTEFPPVVVFKIYTDAKAVPTQYVAPTLMNGNRQIIDKTKFYEDIVKVRGRYSVTSQLLDDEIQHSQHGIVSPYECVTTKECLKLKSLREELPAYMGGKGNTWRKLTLSDVPRLTILHDVLSFSLSPKIANKLQRRQYRYQQPVPNSLHVRAILPFLMANNDLQTHFRLLTAVCRDVDIPPPSAAAAALLKAESPTLSSAQRQKAAKSRARKLLNLYSRKSDDDSFTDTTVENIVVTLPTGTGKLSNEVTNTSFFDDDVEANELFEWSKNLPNEVD